MKEVSPVEDVSIDDLIKQSLKKTQKRDGRLVTFELLIFPKL